MKLKQPLKPIKTLRKQKFVDEMANPENQSQTQAARNAGYSHKTAAQAASRLLTNVDVQQALAERKREAEQYADVSRKAVFGATAQRAFASIDDAYDEHGNFDMAKARATGAVHLIKSITRTPNQFGESVKVEFYSKADAQNKLGNYLGMEKQADENPSTVERSQKERFLAALQTLLDAGDDGQTARAFIIKAYPESEKYLN